MCGLSSGGLAFLVISGLILICLTGRLYLLPAYVPLGSVPLVGEMDGRGFRSHLDSKF
jgi:hypothetical protein